MMSRSEATCRWTQHTPAYVVARLHGADPGALEQDRSEARVAWPSGMCSMEGSGLGREEPGCLRGVGDEVELVRSARDHYEHALDPSARGHPIGDQHRIRQVRRHADGSHP
jgi:hypothetical protein